MALIEEEKIGIITDHLREFSIGKLHLKLNDEDLRVLGIENFEVNFDLFKTEPGLKEKLPDGVYENMLQAVKFIGAYVNSGVKVLYTFKEGNQPFYSFRILDIEKMGERDRQNYLEKMEKRVPTFRDSAQIKRIRIMGAFNDNFSVKEQRSALEKVIKKITNREKEKIDLFLNCYSQLIALQLKKAKKEMGKRFENTKGEERFYVEWIPTKATD